MNYDEFRRIVVAPYWCPGSPLDWHDNNVGLAYFAKQGKVGKFNLAWWSLGQPPVPLSARMYQDSRALRWALVRGELVKLEGKPLTDRAAMMKLQDFNQMMRRALRSLHNAPESLAQFESSGMTVGHLLELANKRPVGA